LAAARTKAMNGGEGLANLALSSGWYCEAKKKG